MSRRDNCWDNAVAECFFSSLKKEKIKKRIYKTRDMARSEIFDYIEMFYDQKGVIAILAVSVQISSSGTQNEAVECHEY